MASVAVIVLSYGRADDTIACVRSLERSTITDMEIIVVDNASPDGSGQKVAAACPRVTLLQNEDNLGFAEGNNVGIRAALDRSARLVLILNNDTLVDPEMIGRLVKTIDDHPDTGAVGAQILYADAPTRLWYAGGSLHVPSASTSHRGIGTEASEQARQPGTCSFITGCAMMVPAGVWRQVGLFDPRFFAYLEDADFCHRVSRAGFVLRYEPGAIVYHKVSSTTTWDSPEYVYLNIRNKLLFLRKHCLPVTWLLGIHRTAYYVIRQAVRAFFLKRDAAAVRAVVYGVADGLRSSAAAHGMGRLAGLRTPSRRGVRR